MKLSCDFWRFLAIAFGVSLAFSVFLNITQYSSLTNLLNINHGRKLIFLWPSDEQDIVEGTLRIEVFIDWESVPENLSMIIKVNDDDGATVQSDPQSYDAIGLSFDTNGDHHTDKDYIFYAMNRYYPPGYAIVHERGITHASIVPKPSPYHKCTYNNQTGYTFTINMPKNEINFHTPMLILLAYEDNSLVTLRFVSAQFKVT